MLIISWNVAGLKPALEKIAIDYAPASSSSKSSITPSSLPFSNYLTLHNSPTILCLQEHKIPLASLSSRCEPYKCSTVEGYESFWSCATNAKSRGFNGVVTYAKIGTVQSANVHPLKNEELDSQGRCVMTDHGSFVLFNVYVPNGGRTSEGLVNKMNFLNALRKAMDEQRREGKSVMLVGDMNAKIDKRDLYWRHRCLNVDVVREGLHVGDKKVVPRWKLDVEKNWDKILSVLQTIEAIPIQSTNPSTKQTFNRFRARVQLQDGRHVMLGSNEDSAEDALDCFNLSEQRYIDPETDESTIIRRKNVIDIDTLAELMSKIANVAWDEKTLRVIAESDEAGLNPDSPSFLWMKAIVEEDEMVDVFRHFYPQAEARFTCWHQFTNKRYTNEGGRIDFTFVDKCLLEHVATLEEQTLRCGKQSHDEPLGEEAALAAATANGLFVGGTYSGGGIATPSQTALDTQFGPNHTGMIYTPPTYSDHIAISLLMNESFGASLGQLALDEKDSSTKKAQPHKKQRSIASFLCAPAAKKSSSGSTTSSQDKKRPSTGSSESAAPSKKPTLNSYFGNANAVNKSSQGKATKTSAKSTSTKGKTVPKNSLLNHFKK